jgi:hypothetical protein
MAASQTARLVWTVHMPTPANSTLMHIHTCYPLCRVHCTSQLHTALHADTSPPPPHLQVVGFDMVDDESKPERRPTKHSPPPAEWTTKHNAAYSYYAYYVYTNLYVLNKYREAKGLNTFTFRCAPRLGPAWLLLPLLLPCI